MELRKFTFIVLVIALVGSLAVSSCKNGTGGEQTANDSLSQYQRDSIDSAYWQNETFKLLLHVNDLNNVGQIDSIELLAPDYMKQCLDHGMMRFYFNIWSIWTEGCIWHDRFDKAVELAQKMQEDALKRNNNYGQFYAYKALGIAYGYKGNYEESEKYLQKAIDIFNNNDINSLVLTHRIYCNVLDAAEHHDKLDAALHDMRAVIDSSRYEETNNKVMWANWNFYYYLELARHLVNTGDYKATEAALDSSEYYEDMEGGWLLNKKQIAAIRSALASAQKDFKKGLEYAKREMQLAEETDDNSGRIVAYTEIVSALQGLGRYQEALDTLLKSNAFNDSLNKISNAEHLNELNKKYEVNELKWQAERDKMQAERRQMYLLIAIVAVVLIAIILFVLSRLHAARRLAKMRAAQERLESELQIARDIQMSMVPSLFPEREGLDMYASMTPAKEVGGDLYGYLLMGDKLYFAVGDVSGKGVPASLFMAQATRLFLTLAKQGMMPAEICTRMNDALSGDDNENGMFVTFFLGLVDLTTGHLDFCNAGHNPPIIGGGENHGDFLDMLPNAPIGLWPGLEYEGEEIDSIKGRTLFIYTDGLNEAENTAQEQFGDDHLLAILRNTRFANARQVIETLADEVSCHRNGAEPNDDLTMMCLCLA